MAVLFLAGVEVGVGEDRGQTRTAPTQKALVHVGPETTSVVPTQVMTLKCTLLPRRLWRHPQPTEPRTRPVPDSDSRPDP